MEIGVVETGKKLLTTISDDDVNKLQQALEEHRNSSPQLTQAYDAFSVSQTLVETGEERLVQVSINPETGMETITNTEEIKNEDISTTMNGLVDSDFDFDISKDNISLEELKKFIENNKDDQVFQNQDISGEVTPEDLAVLLDLLVKYQNKEEISSPFNKLPECCKRIITSAMGPGYENAYSSQLNQFRNDMAELFLDQFSTSIILERAQTAMNSGMEKIFNQATGEIGDTIVGYTEKRNEEYKAEIEKIEDPEKKEKALELLSIIDNAYNLDEIKEFCKKCKIRKIDVEKPTEQKNNDMDHIMSKYADTNKFNIYNLYNAQAALVRNINYDPEKFQFTDKQIRAFMIAFSKYCMNYDPNNTKEHAFMFYTIYNIILTDVNKGEKADISNKFLDNVIDCIENLCERNPFLK